MTETALVLRPDGKLVHDGIVVGVYEDGKLVVNLGWARMAGMGVVVENDPAVDRNRSGKVLER